MNTPCRQWAGESRRCLGENDEYDGDDHDIVMMKIQRHAQLRSVFLLAFLRGKLNTRVFEVLLASLIGPDTSWIPSKWGRLPRQHCSARASARPVIQGCDDDPSTAERLWRPSCRYRGRRRCSPSRGASPAAFAEPGASAKGRTRARRGLLPRAPTWCTCPRTPKRETRRSARSRRSSCCSAGTSPTRPCGGTSSPSKRRRSSTSAALRCRCRRRQRRRSNPIPLASAKSTGTTTGPQPSLSRRRRGGEGGDCPAHEAKLCYASSNSSTSSGRHRRTRQTRKNRRRNLLQLRSRWLVCSKLLNAHSNNAGFLLIGIWRCSCWCVCQK